jgi:hypothetical protein
MSYLHSLVAAITLLAVGTTALSAAAQPQPGSDGQQPPTVRIGNGVTIGVPSSVIIEGRTSDQWNIPRSGSSSDNPRSSTCLPADNLIPYARDSVTGAICH